MANILFLQNLAMEYLGVMSLSSYLKLYKHRVEARILPVRPRVQELRSILETQPTIAAFSCTTGNHVWALQVASAIKKISPHTMILMGGAHPTFFPEVIQEEAVDIICRGEGEYALLELCDRLDRGRDYKDVLNLWVKEAGVVYRNDVRCLANDLDALPFPDRQLYRPHELPYRSSRAFMTGRGCPFACTYCFNHSQKKLYAGKGLYVRRRSVEHVLSEIEGEMKRGRWQTVYFLDDTFSLHRGWLAEFLPQYQRRIGRPFICHLSIEALDEPLVQKLAAAGCVRAFIGVETGSEERRMGLLKKRISNVRVVEAAKWLKESGIEFRTYNMLGLPGETFEQACETVELNQKLQTPFPWCSLFFPYPGTELTDVARAGGYLDQAHGAESLSASFFAGSPIRGSGYERIENLQKLFYFAVKFPVLWPIIRELTRLPLRGLYSLLFLIGYALSFKVSECMSWREIISIARCNVRPMFSCRRSE